MTRTVYAALTALLLTALHTSAAAAAGSTGGVSTSTSSTDSGSTSTRSQTLAAAAGPTHPSRGAGTAFWLVALCCMLACLLSLAFKAARPWVVILMAAIILATLLVLWTHPVWLPAAVGLPATALAALMAVRYRLTEHLKEPEQSEVVVFLSGLILCGAAAYLWGSTKAGWSRNLLYVVLEGAALLLFLWKLRQPLVLWVLSVAMTHLGMSAAQAALAPAGASRVLMLTGAAMAAAGIAAAAIRQNTLTVVLSCELVVLGAVAAGAGVTGGLLNTQVGWTVAVGLPLVQTGLGLALAQKLGPGTQREGDAE